MSCSSAGPTTFVVTPGIVQIGSLQGTSEQASIPAGFYTLVETMTGFGFKPTVLPDSPPKHYGNLDALAARFLNTWAVTGKSLGALLCGQKGSGKTELAVKTARNAIAQGLPVVRVQGKIFGPELDFFFSRIPQRIVLLVDEIDKIYKKDKEVDLAVMLPLLDHSIAGNRLLVASCNDSDKLDENMLNRPGRFHYLINFGRVSEDIIREYCADVLKDQAKTNDVVSFAGPFATFSFDMLRALVSEINLYGESVEDAAGMLNIRGDEDYADHLFRLTLGGEAVSIETPVLRFNPMSRNDSVWLRFNEPGKGGDLDDSHLQVKAAEISSYDRIRGVFTYTGVFEGKPYVVEASQFTESVFRLPKSGPSSSDAYPD